MKYTNSYHSLANFGRELLDKNSLVEGLPLISKYAKDVIGAQRCSIFIYDDQKKEFWTTISDGVEKIIVAADKGLVGYTLKTKRPVVANDAYAHPQFLSDIDKGTGFTTSSVITAPIFSSTNEVVGVFELLNKEDGFSNDDVKFMVFFAHYISGFIELTDIFLKEEGL